MYELKACGPGCAGNDVDSHPATKRPNQTQPRTRLPPAQPASPGGSRIRRDRFSDGRPAPETIDSDTGSDAWIEMPDVSLSLETFEVRISLASCIRPRLSQPAGRHLLRR